MSCDWECGLEVVDLSGILGFGDEVVLRASLGVRRWDSSR